MKKVLLTMVGALVFMSMMAATGADKKDGVKTPVSRTDCVTKTEMQIFGIPQVGCRDMRGNYCENQPLLPDIEVYNTPEDYLTGHDRQLERAIQEMLK